MRPANPILFRPGADPLTVIVTKRSSLSGRTHEMTIACSEFALISGLKHWQAGALIQDAFPRLNADEREFLMTGITPAEWKEFAGEG